MARTVSEIYDEIITEKETFSSLSSLSPDPETASNLISELTSSSVVAIWRLWFWVVAFAIWSHEKIFDLHKEELTEFSESLIGGTARWLRDQCFIYQAGDALSYNSTTKKFEYAIEDTSVQIIKRAAVIQAGGVVRLKVAKLVGGLPAALTPAELSSFNTYIQQIKFAGTIVTPTSGNPDELRVYFNLYYDPLVLNPDGTLISDGSTLPVEDAINDYIGNLPFNGVLNLTALVDAVQAASGVVDPVLTSASARFGSNPFTGFSVEYTADAGYMIIDPTAGFTLTDTITYIST